MGQGKLANGRLVHTPQALPAEQEGPQAAERFIPLVEGKRCQQKAAPKGKRCQRRPAPKGKRCQQRAAPKGKRCQHRASPKGKRCQQRAAPNGKRCQQRAAPKGKRCQQRAAPKGGEITYSDQVLNLFGGAKVCQLDPASIVHQDVGALDVTVHDVVLVQVLQAQQDLAAVHLHHGLLECAWRGS